MPFDEVVHLLFSIRTILSDVWNRLNGTQESWRAYSFACDCIFKAASRNNFLFQLTAHASVTKTESRATFVVRDAWLREFSFPDGGIRKK